jgi:hypothetical protein
MDIKTQVRKRVRRHIELELYDEWAGEGSGYAIYWLSDPRDIRFVRYVGQTRSPRRRFLQHLSTARLWLPEEIPWWVQSPKLRPLYCWIRELYRDDYRLPTMVIHSWVPSVRDARIAERSLIHGCLATQLPLLNVEAEILKHRPPLL